MIRQAKYLILSFLCLAGLTAKGIYYTGKTDTKNDVKWTYDVNYTWNSDTRWSKITGASIGDKASVRVPSSFKYASLGHSVRVIGSEVFASKKKLTEIALPNSVREIGTSAFQYCTNLKTINWPSSLETIGAYAFGDASALTDLTLPASLKTISKGAFWTATGLKKADLSNTKLTAINENVFRQCTSLEAISLPSSVTTLGVSAFKDCSQLPRVVLPTGLTTLNESVFEYCSALKTINLDKTKATSIPKYAFRYCTSLAQVAIPSTVTSIGDIAFGDCRQIENVTIPSGVTSFGAGVFWSCTGLQTADLSALRATTLGANTFNNCPSLTSVKLPPNLTAIYASAFHGCRALPHITLPIDTLAHIDASVFEGCSALAEIELPYNLAYLGADAFKNCTSLTAIATPGSLGDILEETFYGCTSLAAASFGEGATSIGKSAFEGCSALVSLTFPSTMRTLSENTFKGCRTLKEVKLPEGLQSIGGKAFADCSALETINFPSTLTTLAGHAFHACGKLKKADLSRAKIPGINGSTFRDCTSLAEVSLPDLPTFTYIQTDAFKNCASLTTIDIPDDVTEVQENAFVGCSALEVAYIYAPRGAIHPQAFPAHTKLVYISDFEYEIHGSEVSITRGPDQEGDLYIPATIKGRPVTVIAEGAFMGRTKITRVVLGDDIEIVEANAFQGCTGLTHVEIPKSVKTIGADAFAGCAALSHARIYGIQNGVNAVKVGDGAFPASCEVVFPGISYRKKSDGTLEIFGANTKDNGWSSDFVIPAAICGSRVTSIDDLAFGDCALTSIVIPDTVTEIGDRVFLNCTMLTNVVLSANVETIGTHAFFNCTSLKSINLPDSLQSLGLYAFGQCYALESIVLPPDIRILEAATFHQCVNLTNVVLSVKLKAIGGSAFENCRQLKSIAIPDAVTQIGDAAFKGCESLTEVTIYADRGTLEWGEDVFPPTMTLKPLYPTEVGFTYEEIAGDPTAIVITGAARAIGALTIPRELNGYTVKRIGADAFAEKAGLTAVHLPETLEGIDARAFSGCTKLTVVTIPAVVRTIGASAFADCPLTELAIPSSVTTADRAFPAGCRITREGSWVYRVDALTDTHATATLLGHENPPAALVIPAAIDGYQISEIGDSAFASQTAITSLELSAALKIIGVSAFENCANLSAVAFGGTLTVGGTYEGVATIKSRAFAGTALTSVQLPYSAQDVAADAFPADCTRVEEVEELKWDLETVGDPVAGVVILGIKTPLPEEYPEILEIPARITSEIDNIVDQPVVKIDARAFRHLPVTDRIAIPAAVNADALAVPPETEVEHAPWIWRMNVDATITIIGRTDGVALDAAAFPTTFDGYPVKRDAPANTEEPEAPVESPAIPEGEQTGLDEEKGLIWLYEVAEETVNGACVTNTTILAVSKLNPAAETDEEAFLPVSGAFEIPSQIDGWTITRIADSAFADNTALTALTLPASVTVIGDNACAGCVKLVEAFIYAEKDAIEIQPSSFPASCAIRYMTAETDAETGVSWAYETNADETVTLTQVAVKGQMPVSVTGVTTFSSAEDLKIVNAAIATALTTDPTATAVEIATDAALGSDEEEIKENIELILDLGLEPSSELVDGVLTLTFKLPTIEVTRFDVAQGVNASGVLTSIGTIGVKVIPAAGTKISPQADLTSVKGCIHVVGTPSLDQGYTPLPDVVFDLAPYLDAATPGEMTLTVDLGTTHKFFKITAGKTAPSP